MERDTLGQETGIPPPLRPSTLHGFLLFLSLFATSCSELLSVWTKEEKIDGLRTLQHALFDTEREDFSQCSRYSRMFSVCSPRWKPLKDFR